MKAYGVSFSSFADRDFDDILDYIAQDNPLRAITFVDELKNVALNTLGTFPKGGSYIAEFDVWFHVHQSYVLVYDIDEDKREVIVHMISHAARKWRSVFAGRL